ncbi:MAG: undecaprenyldiphospho-muramoylpentapeptide beta-N-acetylglucosaminyltransferase [Flavobacteriales bacterium]|nr:undecaprenyldiphospho-muramoylpentapeptide beta-N-acetylglucosaminyltransferase [Flavobacteriales bacterium]|tara:strand:+ start:551 stop:1654 length:1104 start_codon:yes stop_codon:yes gene_type:complete
MKQYRIIISGGGTGGHIFPAVAIARELESRFENLEILFIGARNRMEMEKVPNAGYNIKGLWISGVDRKISLKNFIFPIKLLHSIIRSFMITFKFKPDLVIGTGGFASFPIVFAASILGRSTLIQEQNSYAGVSNKVLSKYVNRICVSYENMERFFPKKKIQFAGNPIRKSILNFDLDIEDSKNFFNLNNENTTILVIGGSLGAKSINESISENISFFVENKLNLLWQTGVLYEETSKNTLTKIGLNTLNCYKFINQMHHAYAAADIIISRAGAIAISELSYVGKPVILIPSPNVAENHQMKNAQSLVNKNSALMVKDVDARLKLVETLEILVKNKNLQKKLGQNIKNLSMPLATSLIVDECLKIIKE